MIIFLLPYKLTVSLSGYFVQRFTTVSTPHYCGLLSVCSVVDLLMCWHCWAKRWDVTRCHWNVWTIWCHSTPSSAMSRRRAKTTCVGDMSPSSERSGEWPGTCLLESLRKLDLVSGSWRYLWYYVVLFIFFSAVRILFNSFLHCIINLVLSRMYFDLCCWQ